MPSSIEPDQGGAGHVPPSAQLLRQFEDKLTQEQVDRRLPTLCVGLARDGVLAWWGSRGTTGIADSAQPTAATQYRIGSITKTFVAVSVMRLRDEGVLDLSDGIGEHVRELAELPVTIAQLMSHTSGLRAETPAPWWERTPGMSFTELVAACARRADLLCRPGRRFHYSNVGYAVLGELVARKRSAPLGEVLRAELLEPLGMQRTTLRPVPPYATGLAVHPHADLVLEEPEHDAVAMAPAGQLWSTVEDLASWSSLLAGQRAQILGTATASEMIEPLALVDAPGKPWTSAYGLGVMVTNQDGARRYGHSGAMPGHWAMLVVDRETKDAVVGFANATYQGIRPGFFDEMLSLFGTEPLRPKGSFAPARGGVLGQTLELSGTWYWGPVEHSISVSNGGGLELRAVPEGRDCSFSPDGSGSYVGQNGYFHGELLVPCRGDDGSLSHLEIASYVFTRRPYDGAAPIPGGLDAKGWYGR